MAPKDPLSASIGILEATKNYNRWIFDNIKNFIGQNVLEIGCGTGNITDYILEKDRNITGIEIDHAFACHAGKKYKGNKSVKIIHGDFLKMKNIKKNHYDTVVTLNVLEHIKNDSLAISKMRASLKKGGTAVMLVPAMHFAYGALDKELGHFRRYEKKDMEKLYAGCGFKIERIFYMNFFGAFAWAFNSRLLGRKDFPQNQPVLFDRFFVPVLKPLEKLIPPFMGQSLIAVGKKN
jgi:SAM-dependent methyltransferase